MKCDILYVIRYVLGFKFSGFARNGDFFGRDESSRLLHQVRTPTCHSLSYCLSAWH